MKSKTRNVLLVIIGLLICGLTTFTFAFYVERDIEGNLANTIVLNTLDYGTITVSYENDNDGFEATLVDLPLEEIGIDKLYMVKFQIASTANVTQNVQIRWINLVNTFCRYASNGICTNDPDDVAVADELSYALYSCTNAQYANITTADDSDIASCTKISNITDQAIPITGSIDTLHTADNVTLAAESTTYYVVTVKLKNLDQPQRYNMNKIFTGSVNVSLPLTTLTDYMLASHPPVDDNVASTYVSANTGIDFTTISTPINGQGLYTNVKNSQDGTVKYFRGGTYCTYTDYDIEDNVGAKCLAAGGTWATQHCSLSDSRDACETAGGTYYELKNNVMFGGYAWKIVRINSDGSIKMIYNGLTPLARGTSAHIGMTVYDQATSIEGSATTSEIALDQLSYTGGILKNNIETWYTNNLSGYSSYIADSAFCNDLDYILSGNYYMFGGFNRNNTLGTPTYNCAQTNTYSLTKGNLSASIATLNIDEVAYAGIAKSVNNYTSYLQIGAHYWTMSPSYYLITASSTRVWFVGYLGYITYNYTSSEFGARPVINLKSDVTVSEGNGSLTDPWVVVTT